MVSYFLDGALFIWTDCNISYLKILLIASELQRIQELHQDIVYDLPEDFTLLASTMHTTNQSMISNDHQIVSVQGHPEFTGEIMKKYIEVRTANGTFSKELSEASSKLVDEPLDRAKIAGRILQFAASKA
jgi:hypothetical protein